MPNNHFPDIRKMVGKTTNQMKRERDISQKLKENPLESPSYKGFKQEFITNKLRVFNWDCMELLQQTPDGYYDLCLVDPPYGIGEDGAKNHTRGGRVKATLYTPKYWDRSTPTMEYFEELIRVSRRQIIWGGNYFPLPPSPCWIVWDKLNGENDFADCELAWTNCKTAVRKFSFRWAGMLQGNMKEKEKRIHPTQKPVALYRWLLDKYSEPGQRILDTHLGSGSHAIASHYFGTHLTACEIDSDYYSDSILRIKHETSQTELFPN